MRVSAAAENLLAPVHDRKDGLARSETFQVRLGETGLQAVEGKGFVDSIGVARSIGHFRQAEGRLDAEGIIGGDLLAGPGTAARPDQDDAVSAPQAEHRRRGGIPQDCDGLHFVGRKEGSVTLDAVHQDDGRIPVERALSPHGQAGRTSPGHAGALADQQAGNLAIQSVEHIPPFRQDHGLPADDIGGQGRRPLGALQSISQLETVFLGPQAGSGCQEGGEDQETLSHNATIRDFGPAHSPCSLHWKEGRSNTTWG